MVDRDTEGVSGQGDEWTTKNDPDNERYQEPPCEPECAASESEKEESGIECEFENRDSSWWCTTHNCWA